MFGHKRSTLTSLLDRMEEREWIRRSTRPEDRRSILIELAPRGRRTASRVQQLVEGLEREILSRLDARDMAGFEATMSAIAEVTRVQVRPRTGPPDAPREKA